MRLVTCSGRCLRMYHLCCAGISKPDSKWKCFSCSHHQHECMICHKKGKEGDSFTKGRKRLFTFYEQWLRYNDIASYMNYFNANLVIDSDREKYMIPEPVVKCINHNCGCFYHMSCIADHPRTGKYENQHYCMFRCPRHYCAACGGSSAVSALLSCVRCCKVYHANCLKNTNHRVLHKKFILCDEHADEQPIEPKPPRVRRNRKRNQETDETPNRKRNSRNERCV